MSEAPKITMPEPPSLPITYFLNTPALVPKKCFMGAGGEELRAVSIADARRYALAAYLAGMEAAAQACDAQEGDAVTRAVAKGCAAAIRRAAEGAKHE